MKIKKREINTIDEPETGFTYCQLCIKAPLYKKVALTPRQNYEASDKELWRQCPNCKKIWAVYELKREARLEPTFEASDNPFDSQGKITGIDNKRKRRSTSDIEALDDEIKRELRAGNTVENIE